MAQTGPAASTTTITTNVSDDYLQPDPVGDADEVVAIAPGSSGSARDQVFALAMGTHRRCGARCPLLLSPPSTIMGAGGAGGDGGLLAVRLLWGWLMESSRFHCVLLDTADLDERVLVTFSVSAALLTLTHGMKWWVDGGGTRALGANVDYLVLEMQHDHAFCVQDRATGERTPLFQGYSGTPLTNGKWLVLCCCHSQELVVVEIPMRRNTSGSGGSTTVRRPTVVPLDKRGTIFHHLFVSYNQDQLLVLSCDRHQDSKFFELALVDLVQTCASNKLAVLSSTVPRPSHVPPDCVRFDNFGRAYCVCKQEGGSHSFVLYYHAMECMTIEEGTGMMRCTFPWRTPPTHWLVSQLNESQLCLFKDHDGTYEVWDVNDSTKPVRTQRRDRRGWAFKRPFVEGGLVFQVSPSMQEIHVTEESSGAQVVTFQLSRPIPEQLDAFIEHFSFPLS
ncbi:hypothetical protein Pelo_468 [Pelomyxa schiedti]|nr:hypothetical protein Pelo_468 [Pelomyxa schiedti]